MDFDFDAPVKIFCPTCNKITNHGLADSINFGNVQSMCAECEDIRDYTPIDHRGILREARRGF